MAYTISVSYVDTSSGQRISKSVNVSPSGDEQHSAIVTVGTTEVDVNFATEIPSVGYILMANLGSTDTLDIGWATADYDLELQPGEVAVLRRIDTSDARLFVKSDGTTDTDNFLYLFLED